MHYSRRCFAIEFHFDFTLITSCTIHDTQSVESLEDRCALHIQRSLVDIQAVGLVSTIWTDDVNVRGKDIVADILARTSEGSDLWLILAACLALEVLEHDVRDRQWRWELQAERQILLSVALVNFDGVVHVVDDHSVVCDVVHSAITTTSLQVTAEGCWGVWPDFDACSVLDHVSNAFAFFFFLKFSYRGIMKRGVVDIDILDDIVCADVLAKGADRNAVRTVAEHVLDKNIGAIWFE